jgi:hypothetical protein
MALALLAAALLTPVGRAAAHDPAFTRTFDLGRCDGFSSTGRNPYFVLEPGFRLVLEGEEDGVLKRVVITVLAETEIVNGIQTRVVRERETEDGALVEVSRNFFAICNRDNSVYYFGEDVDIYENDVIVGHDGSWRAGQDDARPGIIMPGTPLVGARYFQEIAPGIAEDRAEVVSVTAVMQTPAGRFSRCVKTVETTPLEPGTSLKWYAPDIGLIRDGALRLVEVTDPGL